MRTEVQGGSLHLTFGRLPPLMLHWSLILGSLLFGRGTFGGAIGFVLLVLVHEVGHAILVRWRRMRTTAIVLHGMGGECRFAGGWATPLDHAIIAWGGVIGQALILVIASAAYVTWGPGRGFVGQLLTVAIGSNLAMIVINLLPFEPLDGAHAWKLPGLLRRKQARARAEREHGRLRSDLDAIQRRRESDDLH